MMASRTTGMLALLALLALLGSGGDAAAQTPDPEAPATAAAEAASATAGLRRGFTHVQVRTVDGALVSGVLQRTAPDTLLLRPGALRPGTVAVPVVGIDTLWRRQSAWKRGAVIGALAGTALYVSIASTIDDHDPDAAALMLPTTTAEGVAFGMVFGGVNGAFIGSRFRRWTLYYTRR
jgi:hypothetical protein